MSLNFEFIAMSKQSLPKKKEEEEEEEKEEK